MGWFISKIIIIIWILIIIILIWFEDKLIEIEINTVHKECKKLQDKYNKLNNQLLDVQFEIFCLSSI